MNNKGQSLVLFVLLIPILIGIMALVIDVGNAWVEKNSLDNITEVVMDYSLEKENDEYKYKEEDIVKLMNANIKKAISTVTIKNDVIVIESSTYSKGIYSNLLNIQGFKIKSKYKGYIFNNKKMIEKEI